MHNLRMTEGLTAEVKVNCYGGESGEEHERYWNAYAAGDKQDDDTKEPLVLDPTYFPPGTKVTVKMPCCPKCGEVYDNCLVRGGLNSCDFDWKNWAEEQYS